MRKKLWPILVLIPVILGVANADDKSNGRGPCSTFYSIVQEDTLGNVKQGITKPKDLRWADQDLEEKYPDVCYSPPDPSVRTVFLITVTPATYQGTRVVTTTNTTPTSGTVTDNNGNTATYSGTETSSSSTAVPYSFEYGKFMLSVETFGVDGKPLIRRRFQQNGIYHTMYGIPLGGRGHHPAKALIEDAVKWIHDGGLTDPFQGVVGQSNEIISAAAPSQVPSALQPPAIAIPSQAIGDKSSSNVSAEGGTASITSSPDGADIFVDSVGRGRAPSLLKLQVGKHKVQLVSSGYKDWVTDIDVKSGSIVNVTGNLEK